MQLLSKLIQYSSQEGDLVCDFFLGSFSTAKVAIGLGRRACGFEKSPVAFAHQIQEISKVVPGKLLEQLRKPPENQYFNQGKALTDAERALIIRRYSELKQSGMTQKAAIEALGVELGRGPWSLGKVIRG